METGHALVKLDFSNAFNSIHRDVMLAAVKQQIPEILRFVDACYGDESTLSYRDVIIDSDEGTQQGDRLGPLYCSVSRMKSEMNL